MICDLQKASLTKRISAFLFDGIMVVIVVMGLALLLSSLLGYDGYMQQMEDCYARYEQAYGIKLDLTMEEFNKLTQEQLDAYKAANEAIGKDQEAIYAYNMVINLTLIIATVSILGAFLVWEFALPLFIGNGQTLGKKIFGIALMRIDGVKINTVSLFVRTVLGKFTLETMVPLLVLALIVMGSLGLTGSLVLLGILILEIVLMVTSRTNAMLHDKLANTVVVDMASQMIFGSELEMIAYKEKLHAEKAARQNY